MRVRRFLRELSLSQADTTQEEEDSSRRSEGNTLLFGERGSKREGWGLQATCEWENIWDGRERAPGSSEILPTCPTASLPLLKPRRKNGEHLHWFPQLLGGMNGRSQIACSYSSPNPFVIPRPKHHSLCRQLGSVIPSLAKPA